MDRRFDPQWSYFVPDDGDEQEVVTLDALARAEDAWREARGLDMATAKYAVAHPVVGAYTGPPPRCAQAARPEARAGGAGARPLRRARGRFGDAPISLVGA